MYNIMTRKKPKVIRQTIWPIVCKKVKDGVSPAIHVQNYDQEKTKVIRQTIWPNVKDGVSPARK